MVTFGNIRPERKNTSEFTIFTILGMEPVLTGVHAGESHKAYFNEKLRQAEQALRRKAKLSIGLLEANRKRDKDLYAKYIITGWKNVVDFEGKEVPFSVENCRAFFDAIDDETFDSIREYFADVTNFQQTIDVESAVGNSSTV